MTDQELNEIEARANAATEGPWELTAAEWEFQVVRAGDRNVEMPHCDEELGENGVGLSEYKANMRFIASARTDVPALVAEGGTGEETRTVIPLLTVAEAADLLRVSERWIRTRCAAGQLRAVRLAGCGPWRIFPEALKQVLPEGCPSPGTRIRSRAQAAMARLGVQPPAVDAPLSLPRRIASCECPSAPADPPRRQSTPPSQLRAGQTTAASVKE